MNRRVFGVEAARLAGLCLAFAASAAVVGCGDGADQTTGTQAEPNPEAVKRQDEMSKFYEKNPLPKPKKQ